MIGFDSFLYIEPKVSEKLIVQLEEGESQTFDSHLLATWLKSYVALLEV